MENHRIIQTKSGGRVRSSIYIPVKIYELIKAPAVEDGFSFNQRVTHLIMAGLRTEIGWRERQNDKFLNEIRLAVKEEYTKQNKEYYKHLEPPENRYEKMKEKREPDVPEKGGGDLFNDEPFQVFAGENPINTDCSIYANQDKKRR